MNHPFTTPGYYQGQANALPMEVARAGQVFGGGQNQDFIGPWAAEAQNIQSHYGAYPLSADAAGKRGRRRGYFTPSDRDPVGNMIRTDAASAGMLDGEMTASQQLALRGIRRSGSMNRQVSVRGGTGYNVPVRPGALRTYSNAPTLDGLGASVEEACANWPPGGAVWDDNRNPMGALLGYILLNGWTEAPPATVGSAGITCITAEVKRRAQAAGIDVGGLSSFEKGYPALEEARVAAGGVPEMGWAQVPLVWAAELLEWTPTDVTSLVEAAKKVNWQEADWLNQWKNATQGPAGGFMPSVSSKAGGSKTPWYSNPWILGAGAVGIVGGVWLLTAK